VVKEKAVSTTQTTTFSNEPARLEKHRRYQRLITTAKNLEPMRTAVVHPCDQSSLEGAINAAEMGLIRPILIGPEAKIADVAQAFNLDISPYECGMSRTFTRRPPRPLTWCAKVGPRR
jgi:hypothetical protein